MPGQGLASAGTPHVAVPRDDACTGGDGVSAGTGDAVLAWTVLRHVRGYLDAWDRNAAHAPELSTTHT